MKNVKTRKVNLNKSNLHPESVTGKALTASGITLVALVVTIIVLLILAGVSLNLVSGSDGILGRASNAADRNNVAKAGEEVELLMSELQSEYYEKVYVNRDSTVTEKSADSYVIAHIDGETTASGYTVDVEGTKLTVKDGSDVIASNEFESATSATLKTGWTGDKKGKSGGSSGSGSGSGGSTTYTTYTVTYNGNGATSGSTASSTHTYGTAKNLTTNGYERVGYDFLGWSTDSTAKTATYSNSQSVSNLSSTNGSTVELFAIWKSKTDWINEIVFGAGDVNVLDASYSTLPNEIWVDGVKQSSNSQTIANLSSGEHQVALDFSGIQVTNMANMFKNCSSLTSIDLSGFDTSSVIDMASMFYGCSSLLSLDLSGWDTSQVIDMTSMFSGCNSLISLDLSGFETGNVISMNQMFSGCNSLLSLDLSNFDMSSIISMNYMFNGCSSLQHLYLPSGDEKLNDAAQNAGLGSVIEYRN